MERRAPVVLVILVEAAKLRWFVAGISLDGALLPLLCSEAGDLSPYQGLDFDQQLAFLRHRFCGVLQRGCDRLWAREKKACQFVFLFAGLLPGTTAELTERLAEHFVQWLLNPPVAVFTGEAGFDQNDPPQLTQLAGQLDPPLQELLHNSLGQLWTATADPGVWELSPQKPYSGEPQPTATPPRSPAAPR